MDAPDHVRFDTSPRGAGKRGPAPAPGPARVPRRVGISSRHRAVPTSSAARHGSSDRNRADPHKCPSIPREVVIRQLQARGVNRDHTARCWRSGPIPGTTPGRLERNLSDHPIAFPEFDCGG